MLKFPSIGIWNDMMLFVGSIAVLSNGYILAALYTDWFLDENDQGIKIAIFIGFVVWNFMVWKYISFLSSKQGKGFKFL